MPKLRVQHLPFSVGTWSTWGSMGTSRGFGMTEMSYSILEGRLMEVRSRGGGGAMTMPGCWRWRAAVGGGGRM